MPVSNPSAFPPPRSPDQIISINGGRDYTGQNAFVAGQNAGNNCAVNDLVLIGTDVGQGGWTDGALANSVAIGTHALAALVGAGGELGANVVIGGGAATLLQYGGANVIIGDSCAATVVSGAGVRSNANVLIGSEAFEFSGTGSADRIENTVGIGYQVAQGTALLPTDVTNCVLIGLLAAQNAVGGNVSTCVVIGASAGSVKFASTAAVSSVVMIGSGADGIVGNHAVFIGSNATCGGSNNVQIGDGSLNPAAQFGVAIGDQVNGLGGSLNVIIGANAGNFNANASNTLIVEVGNESTNKNQRLIYGVFAGAIDGTGGGALILGNSQHGVNEDTQGVNSVKLLNGAVGGANPIGGGYFYVAAGALHWVGSSGTDTTVAPA